MNCWPWPRPSNNTANIRWPTPSAGRRPGGVTPATIPTLQALRGFGVRGDLNGDTYFLGNDRLFHGPEFRLSDEDSNRIRNDGGT